jgi:predicted transcriptional regulator
LKGFDAMADPNDNPGASDTELLQWGSDIVSAYVTRNQVGVAALPDLIRNVHQALKGLDGGTSDAVAQPAAKQKPAVPISRSVQHDYIVCLEDGKQLTMLKRYLRARYDLSPEEYRRKWGLPPEYPMVAPAYAQRRSNFAKQIGLGKGVRRK